MEGKNILQFLYSYTSKTFIKGNDTDTDIMDYIGENIITENQVRVLNLFSCFYIKISDNFNKILSKECLCST